MTGVRLSDALSSRWWDFQSAQALADYDISLFFLSSPSHPVGFLRHINIFGSWSFY